MKRIIIHWTAGTHAVSNLDKEHYHLVIDGNGARHFGKWPIRANENPVKGAYAAHTLNCNTGSIGIAVAAMAGAVERPFDPGKYPMNSAQIGSLIIECARLCKEYSIPVTRETVLTHAEVQPTLGIRQRGKWDITWLPGMKRPVDPLAVGDELRAMISAQLKPVVVAPTPVDDRKPAAPIGFWAALGKYLSTIFHRKGKTDDGLR